MDKMFREKSLRWSTRKIVDFYWSVNVFEINFYLINFFWIVKHI